MNASDLTAFAYKNSCGVLDASTPGHTCSSWYPHANHRLLVWFPLTYCYMIMKWTNQDMSLSECIQYCYDLILFMHSPIHYLKPLRQLINNCMHQPVSSVLMRHGSSYKQIQWLRIDPMTTCGCIHTDTDHQLWMYQNADASKCRCIKMRMHQIFFISMLE